MLKKGNDNELMIFINVNLIMNYYYYSAFKDT